MPRGKDMRSDKKLICRILECADIGLTSAQTARVCDCTTEFARDIAKRHGLQFAKKQHGYKNDDFQNTAIVAAVMMDETISDDEIAMKTHTSASTVRRYRQVNKVYQKSISLIERLVYRAIYDAIIDMLGNCNRGYDDAEAKP